MNRVTVLVTGAGGAATPTLIEHLQGLGYRVIACDMDKHAAGLYFADKGYVIPTGRNGMWSDAMERICKLEQVDVVIPLVDEELGRVHDRLRKVRVIAPEDGFACVCIDKQECMYILEENNFRVPQTWHDLGDISLVGPIIIKPRQGRGSRGVRLLRTWKDVVDFQQHPKSGEFIAQEYIDGPEYTVSVVCDATNTVHAVVPKEIIDKRGITRIAVTRRNERIDAVCRGIAVALKPCGPFNVQLRMRDGEPYVFEINPRFSTSVTLTMAAGCDEVGGLVALALGKPYQWGEWREGVVLVRRTQDVVMDQAYLASRGPQEA